MKQEVLSPAASALLKGQHAVAEGWCQGFGRGPRVCAVEALWYNADGPAQMKGLRFLLQALPPGWVNVMTYNDDKTTTKADILNLYTRAIQLALEAGQ